MKKWLSTVLAITMMCCVIPAASASTKERLYRGEEVVELHSLDYEARTYQRITGGEDIDTVLEMLKDYTSVYTGADDKMCGFLIFTPENKYEMNLPGNVTEWEEDTRALYQMSQKMNLKYPRHVQWFAYMGTENIESIEFGGMGGAGYTQSIDQYDKTFSIEAKLTERDSIEKASQYLKNITVKPAHGIYIDNYRNPSAAAGLFRLDITFKNGINYGCFGPFLSIISSDMEEQIAYSSDYEDNLNSLRDLMAEMPEAMLSDLE